MLSSWPSVTDKDVWCPPPSLMRREMSERCLAVKNPVGDLVRPFVDGSGRAHGFWRSGCRFPDMFSTSVTRDMRGRAVWILTRRQWLTTIAFTLSACRAERHADQSPAKPDEAASITLLVDGMI